jgi:hypothetical protein
LRKVEQGSRDATPALTAAIAKALGVDVTSLTGQPYYDSRTLRSIAVCNALVAVRYG